MAVNLAATAFLLLMGSYAKTASNPRLRLTPDETAFLADHPVIRVHNEKSWPPMNYFEVAGLKGILSNT